MSNFIKRPPNYMPNILKFAHYTHIHIENQLEASPSHIYMWSKYEYTLYDDIIWEKYKVNINLGSRRIF